jgi:hypothetical protein
MKLAKEIGGYIWENRYYPQNSQERIFLAHTRRGDMMIGLISFTENWGKILDLDKFVLLCLHISNRIAIPQYLFDSNFKNTVSSEVGPHVR